MSNNLILLEGCNNLELSKVCSNKALNTVLACNKLELSNLQEYCTDSQDPIPEDNFQSG